MSPTLRSKELRDSASPRVLPGPRYIRVGAMDVAKPYNFIGFGAMDVAKPYKFIGFGAMDVAKPYKFIWFGAMDVCPRPKPTRARRHTGLG